MRARLRGEGCVSENQQKSVRIGEKNVRMGEEESGKKKV